MGRFAIYGPTHEVAPNEIGTRRRSVMELAAQKTFLREGDVAKQFFTLYSGWAIKLKQLPDGRRQILSFLLPGDPIVVESLFVPDFVLPFSIKSLTPISMCVFSVGDIAAITQRTPEQSARLTRTFSDSLAASNSRALDLGRRSALGRLANLILELEERLKRKNMVEDGRFFFPARQEHLADSLGLTTAHVNRTLDRLRRDRIIDFNRRHMTVLDMDRLKHVAADD